MRSWLAPLLAGAIVASAGVPDPAEAELAIDLYGGPSWTQSADLRASGRDDTGNFVDATLQDIRTNTGMTFGLRLGYWLDSLPFVGLGLDVFYFSIPVPGQTVPATGTLQSEIAGEPITINAGQARIPSTTLPVLGFSPELRLRVPLITSKNPPNGLLQPYVTAGPAWALTLKGDEVDLIIGGKIGAGLAVSPLKFLALFASTDTHSFRTTSSRIRV